MSISNEEMDRLENALFSCVRITKKPAYWEEFQRRSGVTIDRPAAYILMMLSQQSLQFQDLVTRLGIEAPSVSRKVHELEDGGLISRQPTADRRVHLLTLSESGKDAAKKIRQARHEILSEILEDWPEKKRLQLSSLLSELADGLSAKFSPKERIKNQ